MDITKKLYLLVFILLTALGVFVYNQPNALVSPDDDELRAARINQAVKRVISGREEEKHNSFFNQVPDMRVTDKYRAAKEEEKKFNVKRRKDAQKINVDLGKEDAESELQARNERIKNVQQTLSKLHEESLPPLPEGFFSATARPYVMYREYTPLTDDFKTLVLKMHSSLLKNVTPFSVLTEVKRILLMVFRTKSSYTSYSGRPDWSGGAANISAQYIYLMENRNFKSNFMHELTHIYFDGFFEPSSAPSWLSEGFAVYVQSLYQSPAENEWLNVFGLKFAREEYIDFEEFTNVPSLSGYEKDDVAMWYAQAYSVVKFLFERYGKDDFYQFSKNLKDGMPLGRAMFRSYGMPLNSAAALESAWQSNLRKQINRGK